MENGQNGYKVKYKSGHFLLRRALMIYQKGILMYLRHSLRGCGDRFPGDSRAVRQAERTSRHSSPDFQVSEADSLARRPQPRGRHLRRLWGAAYSTNKI